MSSSEVDSSEKIAPCIDCDYFSYYGCTKGVLCEKLRLWQKANDNEKKD